MRTLWAAAALGGHSYGAGGRGLGLGATSVIGSFCEIAFEELNDTARREMRRLIRLDPEFDFFSDSCTPYPTTTRGLVPFGIIASPIALWLFSKNETIAPLEPVTSRVQLPVRQVSSPTCKCFLEATIFVLPPRI
jgi:hypothetical protein